MRAAPAILVGAVALVVWTANGVGAGESLLFLAHFAGFVLAPGCAAYLALAKERPSPLRLLAIGGGLGYGLQIAALCLAGVAGTDAVLFAYPPLAVGSGLALATRRGTLGRPKAGDPGPAVWWALAAIASVAIGLYAAAEYRPTPLPPHPPGVTYSEDYLNEISLTAEARHHWPLRDPSVAGVPLDYHLFPYLDMAAASRVTGVETSVAVLRLYGVLQIALLALQLCWAAWSLTHSRAVAAIAPAVVMLAGEFDPDPIHAVVFGQVNDFDFMRGLLLSMVLFVPLVALLGERLTRGDRAPGEWAAIALLLGAGAGARGIAILPLLGGALALWIGAGLLGRARRSRAAWLLLAALVATMVVTYLVVYGGESRGSQLSLPGAFEEMRGLKWLRNDLGLGELPFAIPFWPLAVVLGTAMLLPALCSGVVALVALGRDQITARHLWQACVAAPALAPMLLVQRHGGSELQPLYFAAVASGPLAAQGLVLLWRRAAAALGPLVLAGLGLIGLIWLGAAGQVQRSFLSTTIELAPEPLNLLALAILLAALWLVWRLRAGRGLPVLAIAGVALCSLVDRPLDALAPIVFRDLSDPRVSASKPPEMTPGIDRGLRWLERRSDPDEVLAVNNQRQRRGKGPPKFFYYSAFAERRVYLEGYGYSSRAFQLGYEDVIDGRVHPFPERQLVNDAAFERADPAALRSLARAGVRWLLVDRVNGGRSAIERRARPVFDGGALAIYRLDPRGRLASSPTSATLSSGDREIAIPSRLATSRTRSASRRL